MKALLACRATTGGGVGHLARCLSVAEAAISRGWEVTVVGVVDAPLGKSLLAESGLAFRTVTSTAELLRQCAQVGAAILHVDDYDAPRDLRKDVNDHGALLSSVEDGEFGRRTADLVIDPGIESSARPQDGSAIIRRGIAMAPMRKSIRAGRARRLASRTAEPEVARKILVVMGGTDPLGATATVMGVVARMGRPVTVDVLVGRQHWDTVREVSERANVRLHDWGGHLVDLAVAADLVISAAGTTSWELACMGIPAVLVPVANNQLSGYRAAIGSGLATGLGLMEDIIANPVAAAGALEAIVASRDLRETLARTARGAVDGFGAERIVEAWEELVDTRSGFTARPANLADARMLLDWRNDPTVRLASRATEVIELSEHLRWLDGVLSDGSRSLLVIERHGQPVGTVRFDEKAPSLAEISVALAPAVRGRGISAAAVRTAERTWRRTAGKAVDVVAYVRPENLASQRLFQRLGYEARPDLAADGWDAYIRAGFNLDPPS